MVKTDRSNSLAILYIQMLSKNKFRIFGSSKKVTFMVNDDHKGIFGWVETIRFQQNS